MCQSWLQRWDCWFVVPCPDDSLPGTRARAGWIRGRCSERVYCIYPTWNKEESLSQNIKKSCGVGLWTAFFSTANLQAIQSSFLHLKSDFIYGQRVAFQYSFQFALSPSASRLFQAAYDATGAHAEFNTHWPAVGTEWVREKIRALSFTSFPFKKATSSKNLGSDAWW